MKLAAKEREREAKRMGKELQKYAEEVQQLKATI